MSKHLGKSLLFLGFFFCLFLEIIIIVLFHLRNLLVISSIREGCVIEKAGV